MKEKRVLTKASQSSKEIKELLNAFPGDVTLLIELGKCYLQDGKLNRAIDILKEAVTKAPDYSVAYRYLGKAYEADGKPKRASETYRNGISVAERSGDLQTAKEMTVFLRRIEKGKSRPTSS
ncbi:MAG: tetratricopeptide repeat protein [Candidatus Marinimicrobia bacterium]|nr:tetratricopeptide repeat protein [Candidatus Neomarinimicrobiota bacterium]